jgi:arylsulfatase A-like enzyme
MNNAGNMNHSFMHVRDIMPTILDITNITPPQKFNGHQVNPIQGSSMLPLFEGKVSTPDPKTSQVGYELFGMKAFFDSPWKILWMPKPVGTGEWELFNIDQDPAEMKDLSKQHPDKLKKMVSQWEQYRQDNGILDVSYDLSEMVKEPH